eukprot:COSAG01_NODE_12983_length_1653_cov_3.584942_3_plen_122_part_00
MPPAPGWTEARRRLPLRAADPAHCLQPPAPFASLRERPGSASRMGVAVAAAGTAGDIVLLRQLAPDPSQSTAATQYYLMLFLLCLFLAPIVSPTSTIVDSLLRGWVVRWALPGALRVVAYP